MTGTGVIQRLFGRALQLRNLANAPNQFGLGVSASSNAIQPPVHLDVSAAGKFAGVTESQLRNPTITVACFGTDLPAVTRIARWPS